MWQSCDFFGVLFGWRARLVTARATATRKRLRGAGQAERAAVCRRDPSAGRHMGQPIVPPRIRPSGTVDTARRLFDLQTLDAGGGDMAWLPRSRIQGAQGKAEQRHDAKQDGR